MASQLREHILITVPVEVSEERLARLKTKFPNVEITVIPTPSPRSVEWKTYKQPGKEAYAGKTILVTLNVLPRTMDDAPDLTYIHLCSSGTDHIMQHPVYTQSSVLMSTSRGIAGPPIAEWVIMTALVHWHKYNYCRELQLQHQWSSATEFMSCRDVVGQRIGIVGYGGIGRHVARIAKAMAMDVYAFTATPKETPGQRRDTGYIVPNTGDPDGSIPTKWFSGLDKPSFHEFLRQDLDIVVLCLPLTPQTRHILSTAEFEILSRRKAFVSNISRGQVIDQPALITALETGQLRGAALDVTDPEPLPADSPLWKAPNVIISPHMSGLIANYGERVIDVLELNLERKSRGEPMVNVIQRGKGY